MIDPPFAIDELEMAWRRVKWDLDHRVFVAFAFEEQLLDLGQEEWLGQVRSELNSDRYSPRSCEICEVPKGNFHIRPGARLEIKDQLVYLALVQEAYQTIRDYLRIGKAQKDFSYLLRGPDDVPWFQQTAFSAWKAFQSLSLERLEQDTQAVLFADISGLYENIDLGRLKEILERIGVPQAVLQPLFKCLWAWAQPRGRGIPQGLSASDLLAKVYLEPVDRQLERGGFDHIRYVDDYRVFCRNRLEAKKALRRLTALLRHYGLNLEVRKTEIFGVDDARSKIEGKIPRIEQLSDELLEAIRAEGFEGPYLRITRLEELEVAQASVARDVLEQAFRENFVGQADSSFDPSLFHYLLGRLGRLRSDVAVALSLEQLTLRPEETDFVLNYLKNFLDANEVAEEIVTYAGSDEAIYEHQRYLIMRWLFDNQVQTERALGLARRIMTDKAQPLWLRSYAIAYVGEFGDSVDLDSIEAAYPSAANDLERAIILCAIRRTSVQRRNSVYSRYGGDGLLNSLAVRWARQSS